MANVKLYYSDMCDRSTRVREYITAKKIEGIEFKDATKDMELQVEIYKIGGKSEVPMLVLDDKVIYGEEEIIENLSKI